MYQQHAGVRQDQSVGAPLDHIVHQLLDEHQRFLGQSLPEIEKLILAAGRMPARRRHPVLEKVVPDFMELREALEEHFRHEETVLFPVIVQIQHAVQARRAIPRPRFGSVRNPIRMLKREHEAEQARLSQFREVCLGYQLPEDAPEAMLTLFEGLRRLDQALRDHWDLENRVLFPRAIELERLPALYDGEG